jgi:alcohol dehydrogenase class IV
VRAVRDAGDIEARHQLMFASTLAGLAFGSASVHIPHAMSHAVATLKHVYAAPGYADRAEMVPHGIAVVINAPAAFRYTALANPARHLEAAAALGADVPALVQGAFAQQRPLVMAPRSVSLEESQGLCRSAMRLR